MVRRGARLSASSPARRPYHNGLNYALYQTGWFACILGAAWGWPHTGSAVAVALIAVHLWLADDRAVEWRLIAVTLAIGLAVEGIQVRHRTYAHFTSGSVVAWMSPPWLLLMWAQFATTFRHSLRHLMTVPVRAAVFGSIGGPIAFLAGERLGAVRLSRPLTVPLAGLAIFWALALAGCAVAARRAGQPSSSSTSAP